MDIELMMLSGASVMHAVCQLRIHPPAQFNYEFSI